MYYIDGVLFMVYVLLNKY